MGNQAPVVCGGGGSSSGKKRKGTVEEEDDDPGWLSLGSIYSSAAAASASPTLAGDSCTPVTPTLPVRQMPRMDELGPPSAAATHRQPVAAGIASAPNGNGSDFLASSVLTPMLLASSVPIAGDGNAAVQVPVPVPGNGNISALTQFGLLPMPSRCIRLSTSPHASLTSSPQRSTRRRTDAYSASSSVDSGESSNGAPQREPSSNGDPPADNGDEAPNNGGLLENPPFPWATNRVAIHHSLSELSNRGIATIEGEVECFHCKTHKTISYDVKAKFNEIAAFILSNILDLDDRAPARWTSPSTPDCDNCSQKNGLKPVIPSKKKEEINWMFLLLGEMLGLCTLEQLKYFCAHTKLHRTGAKDRVLYSTYMELCNQLFPNGPFDLTSQRKNRSLRYA